MLALSSPAMAETEKLTVLLDWFVNPDHAPLILAREKGYFDEAGLEVELLAPADPNDPPKLVAAGKADIAVSYQPQLHLQAAAGLPLVRIGTLVATPLNSLVVLEDGPIRAIADLKGKKVGFSVGGFEDALLSAMLAKAGLSLADVELVNVNWSLSPSLVAGHVDAVIGAFRNFELNQMELIGRPGRAFFVEEEGVPAYDELILVANAKDLKRPALARFRTGDPVHRQPPRGGLGGLQGHRQGTGQRAERPRLARYAAALRLAPRGPGPGPLRALRGLLAGDAPAPLETYAVELATGDGGN
jgi:putative hydroxymethylpyrimidine transport system substrate-binding protein